jgi:hypothetical protein
MKAAALRSLRGVVLGLLPWFTWPTAAVGQASDPAIKLPPMIVEDSKDKPRWLYAFVGGTEYLSLCSSKVTQRYIETHERRMQLVRVLVPESFLVRMDAPTTMILYSQDTKQSRQSPASSEALRTLLRTQAGDWNSAQLRLDRAPAFAPNMRIDDRDTHASFAFINETDFDPTVMIVAPNYVRYQLERRVPLLPAWLIEGIDQTYRNSDFTQEPISLAPFTWIDRYESSRFEASADRPRPLLPAIELFAPDCLRGEDKSHPRRVAVLQSEVALFVRWALDSGGPSRAALWKFAARCAEAPVTEEMFQECFDFGYAELRDRLSDYLVRAVREKARILPGPLPDIPRITVRPATPNEIARLRGEWERCAANYVQTRLPEYRATYLAQAQRTLRRAYDDGDRDPRLLATMALGHLENGDEAAARPLLESAVAAGIVRPRIYYELARLRWNALKRDQPATRSFTYAELAAVFEPLRSAARQAPALPEVFGLFAEAWVRCTSQPEPRDVAILQQGARGFALRENVNFPLALALARHGHNAEAEALLSLGYDYVTDESMRARFSQLRAWLTARPSSAAAK